MAMIFLLHICYCIFFVLYQKKEHFQLVSNVHYKVNKNIKMNRGCSTFQHSFSIFSGHFFQVDLDLPVPECLH